MFAKSSNICRPSERVSFGWSIRYRKKSKSKIFIWNDTPTEVEIYFTSGSASSPIGIVGLVWKSSLKLEKYISLIVGSLGFSIREKIKVL